MSGNRLLVLIVCCVLCACGGGASDPGMPGWSGSVGAKIVIDGSSHVSVAEESSSWEIDIRQEICSVSSDGSAELEPFGADYLKLQLRAEPLYDADITSNLTITHYEVQYFPLDPYVMPPLESFTTAHTVVVVPDGETVTEETFLVFPVWKKNQLLEMYDTGQIDVFPLLYSFTVTFYGQNDYGEEFQFVYQDTMEVGFYDRC